MLNFSSRRCGEMIMENPNYPFFKLTLDEQFPRLLVTRRPEHKTFEQNIYGAVLPTGMVRRKLDLLQKIFRLRPCELDITGDFDAPCPEFFLHRCLAPCVAAICPQENYLEIIELVHLILSNQTESALKKITGKIERLAEDLEYEQAAEWRDRRAQIEEIAVNAKWQIDVARMNDVLTFNAGKDVAEIHLTTLRRGKSVGSLYFQTENNRSAADIVKNFIVGFYEFYAPKQIFVPFDFPDRKLVEDELSARFGRRIKIVATAPDKLPPPSVLKTSNLAAHSFKHRTGLSFGEKSVLLEEIKTIFKMRKTPQRIECFDVAHLAGKEIIGARVVADAGVLRQEDGLVWEFENLTETAALAAAVRERLRLLPTKKELPDLLIVDGAKPQINAVLKITAEFGLKNLIVVGAVKPPQSHNQISHFLTAKNERIEFDGRLRALNFLQSLRDAAHTLANETHRELHSLVGIFKNNHNAPRVQYLLVPTIYAERGGDAADLSPIRALTQAGEIILKSKGKLENQKNGNGKIRFNSRHK